MLKVPMPEFIAPMMASVAKEPFNHRDWMFETKLDGYRAIAVIDSLGKARIWSRNRLAGFISRDPEEAPRCKEPWMPKRR